MATITPRTKRDGSVTYIAQIRLRIDGRQVGDAMTSPDRGFLELWVQKREAELRRADGPSLRFMGTTLKQVFEWYLEDFQGRTRFGRTKLSHINFLLSYPGLADLDAITMSPRHLIAHARRRMTIDGAMPATINNDFVWLRSAVDSARLGRGAPLSVQAIDDATALLRREKVIGKAKRRERRPSLDELNRLLEYFADRDERAKMSMVEVVLFALFSSRRQEEICRIEWADVDERRQGVLVRDMKHPRDKINTFVELPDPAWAVLQRQPSKAVGGRVFPYLGKTVSGVFTRSCSFLEIQDLRFHDLRHECVSWLFELGRDIPRVSAVSGHKSWSSLQRYTHLRDGGVYNKYKDWAWLPGVG